MTQEFIPKCAICLDTCVIPVEITSFECYEYNKPSCFSFHRVCELCAIKYLELNIPSEQRSESKRCLFCDSVCNPKSALLFYRKDYLLIQLDPNPNVSCPNSDCNIVGTHSFIENHYSKSCDYTIISCICNKYGIRKLMNSREHCLNCVFYRECIECKSMIYINKLSDHYKINHNMKLCNICKIPTKLSLNQHLIEECLMRLVNCPYCHKYLQAKSYMEHCIEHVIEIRQRIDILKKVYDKELILLDKIIKDCKQID